jgi:hypothetical protein
MHGRDSQATGNNRTRRITGQPHHAPMRDAAIEIPPWGWIVFGVVVVVLLVIDHIAHRGRTRRITQSRAAMERHLDCGRFGLQLVGLRSSRHPIGQRISGETFSPFSVCARSISYSPTRSVSSRTCTTVWQSCSPLLASSFWPIQSSIFTRFFLSPSPWLSLGSASG